MADDEQFSLCWNNFNTNLSAGFHESLCRGDLVDVTLAAEGQMVKAHRLVLSVCSPYFRKMFTQMPANQHAFVFLKDVSHSALKDLIQFMYCGEVNVKHDALPAFISTAEALQIKGLTETAEANNTASPAKAPTPAPSASSTTSPRSRAQRNISRTSYKLESEDSNDERPIIVPTQKRGAQRSVTPQSAPAVKRIKSIDPLEAAEPIQETVTPDKSEEPEFIDLPIESIPTKSEPEYAEDSAEVESAEQDASYVEDDSYGDMKYDESYFTENDDSGKPGVSGFSESYTTEGDQSATEAQVYVPKLTKLKGSKRKLISNFENRNKQKTINQSLPGPPSGQIEFLDEAILSGPDLNKEQRDHLIKSLASSKPNTMYEKIKHLIKKEPELIIDDPLNIDFHKKTLITNPHLVNVMSKIQCPVSNLNLTKFKKVVGSKNIIKQKTEEQENEKVDIKKSEESPSTEIIPEKNIQDIKNTDNSHLLVVINRPRVKGFCVECIKKQPNLEYKKTMKKITTYCPKCPGGNWICNVCFDELHK